MTPELKGKLHPYRLHGVLLGIVAAFAASTAQSRCTKPSPGFYAAIRQPLSISNTIKQPFYKLRVTGISSLTNIVLSG